MRFRVPQLLLLLTLAASLAAALAMPSEIVAGTVSFAVWSCYTIMAWRFFAFSRRMALGSCLLFGVSFLCLQNLYWGRRTLPIIASTYVLDAILGVDETGFRVSVEEYAWSVVFATIGAAFGAWSGNKSRAACVTTPRQD